MAGELVVKDYQIEYRGLLIGSGTSYIIESLDGLTSVPESRSNDQDRQDGHGAHPGLDLLSGRRMMLELVITGAPGADTEGKRRAATNVFQVSKNSGIVEHPLHTQRPGRGKVFVNCRARRSAFVSTYEAAHGVWRGVIELFASDPRVYSNTETSTQIDIAQGSSSATQQNVVMNGDFLDGVQPVIELQGPTNNPRIQNINDNNRSLRLDVVMGAGQVMLIDMHKKTVTIDGIDRYDIVRNDNQWWSLLPGNNNILFTRTGTTGLSRLFIRKRDAYITA